MLTSISWQQYLQAIAILTASYYAAVLLLYFRVELFALINRIKNGKSIHETPFGKKEVLGAIAPDQYERSIDTEELEFAPNESNQLIGKSL